MDFRNEWKFEINNSDIVILRSRLRAVLKADAHSINGKYLIHSLYFDDVFDTALREKQNGVQKREKFRIRYYNDDLNVMHLEKKFKYNNMSRKTSCNITREEVKSILDGNYLFLKKYEDSQDQALLFELYRKMECGLRPKVIVTYEREPFVYKAGNVRVTLDYNIRTSLCVKDFLNPKHVTIGVPYSPSILEVKWDNYLPDIVKSAVTIPGRRVGAFSKYAAARSYG